jgi:hypothetical protein
MPKTPDKILPLFIIDSPSPGKPRPAQFCNDGRCVIPSDLTLIVGRDQTGREPRAMWQGGKFEGAVVCVCGDLQWGCRLIGTHG